jgi:hypothetical protein
MSAVAATATRTDRRRRPRRNEHEYACEACASAASLCDVWVDDCAAWVDCHRCGSRTVLCGTLDPGWGPAPPLDDAER